MHLTRSSVLAQQLPFARALRHHFVTVSLRGHRWMRALVSGQGKSAVPLATASAPPLTLDESVILSMLLMCVLTVPCRACVHLPQHWVLCEWCAVRGDGSESVACGREDVLMQLLGLLQTEGRAVRVWWDGEQRWYEGVVLSYNSNHLLVDSHGDASHFFSLKRVLQTRITPR